MIRKKKRDPSPASGRTDKHSESPRRWGRRKNAWRYVSNSIVLKIAYLPILSCQVPSRRHSCNGTDLRTSSRSKVLLASYKRFLAWPLANRHGRRFAQQGRLYSFLHRPCKLCWKGGRHVGTKIRFGHVGEAVWGISQRDVWSKTVGKRFMWSFSADKRRVACAIEGKKGLVFFLVICPLG